MRIRSGIAAALTAICAILAPAPSAQATEPDLGPADSVVNEATRLCPGSDTDGNVHTVECRWNSPYRQGVSEAVTAGGTIGLGNVPTDGCRLKGLATSVRTTRYPPTHRLRPESRVRHGHAPSTPPARAGRIRGWPRHTTDGRPGTTPQVHGLPVKTTLGSEVFLASLPGLPVCTFAAHRVGAGAFDRPRWGPARQFSSSGP
ncbi:hypothetical protein [Streptomyces racemochromogenes]|uniref:hypothetical protein n=1 Tax=Streptomyces racemochromogenes TaxID=67353 RepID=UPI00336EDF52